MEYENKSFYRNFFKLDECFIQIEIFTLQTSLNNIREFSLLKHSSHEKLYTDYDFPTTIHLYSHEFSILSFN